MADDENGTGAPRLLPASAVLGAALHNRTGECLGTVCEAMLDPATGGIAYVVLAFGGVLGLGEKLFAVPWSALAVTPAGDGLVLDATPEQLAAAPGIDKDAWPTRADAAWRSVRSA